MNYSKLIKDANAQASTLHNIFPANTSQLLSSVILAIKDQEVSPEQYEQLKLLKNKLQNLHNHRRRSFLGSTTI